MREEIRISVDDLFGRFRCQIGLHVDLSVVLRSHSNDQLSLEDVDSNTLSIRRTKLCLDISVWPNAVQPWWPISHVRSDIGRN